MVRGSSFRSDMAIDEVRVRDKDVPTTTTPTTTTPTTTTPTTTTPTTTTPTTTTPTTTTPTTTTPTTTTPAVVTESCGFDAGIRQIQYTIYINMYKCLYIFVVVAKF